MAAQNVGQRIADPFLILQCVSALNAAALIERADFALLCFEVVFLKVEQADLGPV
ncbi:MAG: hypothetical protein AAB342_05260 [Chloroflexota bacterium]